MDYLTRKFGQVNLLVSKQISGISVTDICSPIATIEFVAHGGFLRNNLILFTFTYNDFLLEAKVMNGRVYIMRNGLFQHSEEYFGIDPCKVAIQWDTTSISCGIIPPGTDKDMNKHMRAVRTPVTSTPKEINNVLRRENLLCNSKYTNMDDFFVTIIDAISLCQEDIHRHGSERLFWFQNEKKEWLPRSEPDISRGIASFLNSYGAMKNFDITCEPLAGSGEMDFYVTAPVNNGIGKIVIEAKKANSEDIVRGFTDQLPYYMQKVGTDYGIYLVYWLKSEFYPYPPLQENYQQLEIEKFHSISRLSTIRTLGLDLSIDPPPSHK